MSDKLKELMEKMAAGGQTVGMVELPMDEALDKLGLNGKEILSRMNRLTEELTPLVVSKSEEMFADMDERSKRFVPIMLCMVLERISDTLKDEYMNVMKQSIMGLLKTHFGSIVEKLQEKAAESEAAATCAEQRPN
jgi:hypothetical protein